MSRYRTQEVCPWNSPKFVTLTCERDFSPRGGAEARSLASLLAMTEEQWDEYSRGSPIRRAKRGGFLRNVAVALGNWLATLDDPPAEAIRALEHALTDDDPLVREHAAWALGRLAARQPPTGARVMASEIGLREPGPLP